MLLVIYKNTESQNGGLWNAGCDVSVYLYMYMYADTEDQSVLQAVS